MKGNETSIVQSFTKPIEKNPTYIPLKIPRRPKWTNEMTAEELDRLEKEAFV